MHMQCLPRKKIMGKQYTGAEIPSSNQDNYVYLIPWHSLISRRGLWVLIGSPKCTEDTTAALVVVPWFCRTLIDTLEAS